MTAIDTTPRTGWRVGRVDVLRTGTSTNRWTEAALVVGYLVVLAVALGRMAAVKAYWFDELFTVHLSRFDSLRQLWANLAAGTDLNPPLVYLLTRLATGVLGETPLAVRLPAILGAILASGGVYAFLRHRRPAAEAFVGMVSIGATAAVWYYFVEARPYGLMTGFAAGLLAAWQRRWPLLAATAAILGMSSHYYFVVPLAGIGAAELLRRDRRMILALAAGGIALLAYYPLWGEAGREYAPGFWAKVKFGVPAIADTYQKLCPADLAPVVVLAVVAAVLFSSLAPASGARGRASPDQDPLTLTLSPEAGARGPEAFPFHELVALVLLAAGPVLGVFLGAKLTGGFYHRYCLPTWVGLACLFAVAIGRISTGNRWACYTAAAGICYFGAVGHYSAGMGFFRNDAVELDKLADFLDEHAPGGTVAFDNAFDAGRVWHHHPDRSFRPAFPADCALAVKHTRADTLDRGALALAKSAGYPAVAFDAATTVTHFYGPIDGWRAKELIARGARLEPVATRGGMTLYRMRNREE